MLDSVLDKGAFLSDVRKHIRLFICFIFTFTKYASFSRLVMWYFRPIIIYAMQILIDVLRSCQMCQWFLFLNVLVPSRRSFVLYHCVKSVEIGSYFWSVFSCIRTEYRKIRTRNNSVSGYFVFVLNTGKNGPEITPY